MGDILLIETDFPVADIPKTIFEDLGIDKIVFLPPIISLGSMAIERLEEYHTLIHELLEVR